MYLVIYCNGVSCLAFKLKDVRGGEVEGGRWGERWRGGGEGVKRGGG